MFRLLVDKKVKLIVYHNIETKNQVKWRDGKTPEIKKQKQKQSKHFKDNLFIYSFFFSYFLKRKSNSLYSKSRSCVFCIPDTSTTTLNIITKNFKRKRKQTSFSTHTPSPTQHFILSIASRYPIPRTFLSSSFRHSSTSNQTRVSRPSHWFCTRV